MILTIPRPNSAPSLLIQKQNEFIFIPKKHDIRAEANRAGYGYGYGDGGGLGLRLQFFCYYGSALV